MLIYETRIIFFPLRTLRALRESFFFADFA